MGRQCKADRTDYLPFVLRGIHTTPTADISCSSTELVDGTTLRLPGEMFSPSTWVDPFDVTNLLHRQFLYWSQPPFVLPSFRPLGWLWINMQLHAMNTLYWRKIDKYEDTNVSGEYRQENTEYVRQAGLVVLQMTTALCSTALHTQNVPSHYKLTRIQPTRIVWGGSAEVMLTAHSSSNYICQSISGIDWLFALVMYMNTLDKTYHSIKKTNSVCGWMWSRKYLRKG